MRRFGLLAIVLASCATPPFQPLLVEPKTGMPPDSYDRCRELVRGRYHRLLVDDKAGFRLQTDWVAGPDRTEASQQRVTMFREGSGIACIVEVRYLGFAMFASTPSWSAPRSDPRLEEELGDAVLRALGDGS